MEPFGVQYKPPSFLVEISEQTKTNQRWYSHLVEIYVQNDICTGVTWSLIFDLRYLNNKKCKVIFASGWNVSVQANICMLRNTNSSGIEFKCDAWQHLVIQISAVQIEVVTWSLILSWDIWTNQNTWWYKSRLCKLWLSTLSTCFT